MTQLKYTGGARIGMSYVTWPFAQLLVTKEKLKLNTTLFGNYSFMPKDIISIEPFSILLGGGLKINHKNTIYARKIIFWTFQDPNFIIQEIKNIGFLNLIISSDNTNVNNYLINNQIQNEFPLKLPFLIVVVSIWTILYNSDFIKIKLNRIPLISGDAIAFGFLLIISCLLLISKDFRKIALKENHKLKEIISFLYLIIIGSVLMLLIILVFSKL